MLKWILYSASVFILTFGLFAIILSGTEGELEDEFTD